MSTGGSNPSPSANRPAGLSGPVKVAFVGTTCSGKTTLLDAFRLRSTGDGSVSFCDEAARRFLATHLEVDGRSSYQTQSRVQAMVCRTELAAHRGGPRLIFCDRSVLDSAIYLSCEGHYGGARRLMDRAASWLPTYSYLFLMDPAGIPYVKDEIRYEPVEFRERFHQTFVEWFAHSDVPHGLLSGSVAARVGEVEHVLHRLLPLAQQHL